MKLQKQYNITDMPCSHLKKLSDMVVSSGIESGSVERKGEEIILSFDILEVKNE